MEKLLQLSLQWLSSYRDWEKELQDLRLETAKSEAALREANHEITELIKKELKPQADAPAEQG